MKLVKRSINNRKKNARVILQKENPAEKQLNAAEQRMLRRCRLAPVQII